MNRFNELVDGTVGTVIETGMDVEGENNLIQFNGKSFQVGDMEDDIDILLDENGTENLTLFRSDGYRGNVCYDGILEVGDRHFLLDIVGEYTWFHLIEVK